MTSMGDAEQTRIIAEQVAGAAASTAIREFVSQHPHFAPPAAKAEIPAPLKWAGIIASGVMTAAVTSACYWGVTTLNELQLTVTRIDERQQNDMTGKRLDALEKNVADNERRISDIERPHR